MWKGLFFLRFLVTFGANFAFLGFFGDLAFSDGGSWIGMLAAIDGGFSAVFDEIGAISLRSGGAVLASGTRPAFFIAS